MKRVGLLIVIVALALGAAFLYDLLVESEEERLESWLTELVQQLPGYEANDYLPLVDLERFGFRLSFMRRSPTFGKGEQAKFLEMAERQVPQIQGSKLTLLRLSVTVEGDVATAQATVQYKRNQAKSYLESAMVGFDAKLARAGQGWRFTHLSVFPARDLLGGLGR